MKIFELRSLVGRNLPPQRFTEEEDRKSVV